MSTLPQAVQDYLEMRRSLGYQLTGYGRVLSQFVAFLEQRDALLITTALALEFATQPTHASVVWRHTRLAIVRGFAIYLKAFDARHRGAARESAAGHVSPGDPVPVLGGRDRRADARRPRVASSAARRHLRDADRALIGHRDAHLGGVRA